MTKNFFSVDRRDENAEILRSIEVKKEVRGRLEKIRQREGAVKNSDAVAEVAERLQRLKVRREVTDRLEKIKERR